MAIREIVYEDITYHVSYELLNQQKEETLVFLHGWGSNKEIMKNAFQGFFGDFRHLYIDMPGFGNSDIHKALKTDDYAKILQSFLQTLHVREKIVFGHSFGGKVATLLNPDILVLLSSAGIVVPKSFKVKTKIRFFKSFKKILPKNMFKFFASKDVSGMSQVMYETFKNVVDEDFKEIFATRNKETYIFWGELDSATPLWCGQEIHALIENSYFKSFAGDHFFFCKFAKDIFEDLQMRIK